VDLFIDSLRLKENDKMLLIIDDTYNEKEGKQTEGVGKFYDHSKESYIWGNNFVTSVIQSKELFIPHKAKMYLKDNDENENFKTKMEIAFEEIIKPLVIPKSISLFIILNTPQLCCGDGHETDLRLKHAMSIDVRIAACKSLCL
jgi:hypothetical protein